MIQAFYEGKKIIEIGKVGYVTDAFTKLQMVFVRFEDGTHRAVRTDKVELVAVA